MVQGTLSDEKYLAPKIDEVVQGQNTAYPHMVAICGEADTRGCGFDSHPHLQIIVSCIENDEVSSDGRAAHNLDNHGEG